MDPAIGAAGEPGRETGWWKLLVVVLVAGVMCTVTGLHVRGVNGPWYWVWRWRQLGTWRVWPPMLAAAIPFFLGQLLAARLPPRRATACVLILSMISSLAMSFIATGLQTPEFGSSALYRTVTDGNANGYLIDADHLITLRDQGRISIGQFLQHFPQIMPMLHMHSRIRAPGIVLFYAIFRSLFPTNGIYAVVVSSLVIGMLASLSIPATYALLKELTGSRDAALTAACWLALSPGFVLFFPQMDTVFPACVCLLILMWIRALRARRTVYAFGFGILLGGLCFLTFNLLVIGAFLGSLTFLEIQRTTDQAEKRRQWGRVFGYAGCSAAGFAGFWILLALTFNFDIVATFKEALHQQNLFDQLARRPFPESIPWDLYDFILGSGWISVAMLLVGSKAWCRGNTRWLVVLCFAQPVLVASLKLLQTETARVWLFMQPLLLLPVGLTLATWTAKQRTLVYAALLFVTLAITQNMWTVGWTGATYP